MWLTGLLLASAGATLATLPLVAYHFGVVSPIGVLANVLVVPPQPALLALGMLALALSFVMPSLALLVGFLLHLLIVWMNEVTRLGALVPGLWFTDVSWPAWLVALYYAVLAAAAVVWVRWQGRSWREIWQ